MRLSFSEDKLDYRPLLKWELQERQRKNSSYSLRAFAKFLGVSPGYLSQVLQKQRTLSESAALKFAKKFRWNLRRQKLFLSLVRYRRVPSEESREALLQQAEALAELEYLELRQDQFELIAGWEHFALAELVGLGGFSPDPVWVSRRLGISRQQAHEAIERLRKVGILVEENGKLMKSQSNYRIQDAPIEAIGNFHETHLKKASLAQDKQPLAARDISGTTVAFDKSRLPEVRQLIREFQEKLDTFCGQSGVPDSVYHLAVQFYRLDNDLK